MSNEHNQFNRQLNSHISEIFENPDNLSVVVSYENGVKLEMSFDTQEKFNRCIDYLNSVKS